MADGRLSTSCLGLCLDAGNRRRSKHPIRWIPSLVREKQTSNDPRASHCSGTYQACTSGGEDECRAQNKVVVGKESPAGGVIHAASGLRRLVNPDATQLTQSMIRQRQSTPASSCRIASWTSNVPILCRSRKPGTPHPNPLIHSARLGMLLQVGRNDDIGGYQVKCQIVLRGMLHSSQLRLACPIRASISPASTAAGTTLTHRLTSGPYGDGSRIVMQTPYCSWWPIICVRVCTPSLRFLPRSTHVGGNGGVRGGLRGPA